MQNLCYENKFDLHENEPEGGTNFHMKGFVRRLVLFVVVLFFSKPARLKEAFVFVSQAYSFVLKQIEIACVLTKHHVSDIK